MNVLLVGVLIVAAAGLFATHIRGEARDTRAQRVRANPAFVCASSVVVAGAFALQLAVVNAAAIAQRPLPHWLAALPVRVIDDRAPLFGHAPFGDLDALAAGLQTLGLIALWVTVRRRQIGRLSSVIIGGASALMLGCALAAPAMTSFDMYAYAATVHGGLAHAYHPANAAFAGDWYAVNRIYGTPVYPSAYGPVWLALAAGATSWIASFAGTIAALRVIELVAFVACVAALRRLGAPAYALALFAMNPAIVADAIVSGHNDLTAVAFVLVAAAMRERFPLGAIALATCAGAIKLPFLLIAPLAFVAETDHGKRVTYALATLALSLGISVIFGGGAYLAAIRQTATTYDAIGHATTDALRLAIAVVVIATVALALLRRRFSPTLAWAFCALGVTFSSWYLVWGTPYAWAERRWFARFLISLPLLAYLFATAYAPTGLSVRTFYLAAGLAPALVVLTLIRERRQRAARAS